ncbi:MAG TPA: hypothetical protein VLA74_10365 [Nitrososphaeraceae archaeon]|nr:hypothetical protein [Nitrososphaeraceae archaeon]
MIYKYIAFLAFFTTVFLLNNHDDNTVEAKLIVDSTLNPDKSSTGNVSVLTTMKNEGNITTAIRVLEIILPWDRIIEELNPPVLLNSNRIYTTSMNITVPDQTKPGNYALTVLVKTNDSDYLTHSKLAISTLEGISLSGEIPFSIIAIIAPGIMTYFIIIYFLTRTFDRSYIEVGLVSVGFGFLDWGILKLLTHSSFYSILILSNHRIEDYIYVFIIAIALGLVVVYTIRFARRIYQLIMKVKIIRDFNQELLIKGYAKSSEPTWISFINQQNDNSKEHGLRYTVGLRIYAKTATSFFTVYSLNGLLRQVDEDPPYHISLRPKYRAACTMTDLIEILKGGSSPLLKNLKENKKFRTKVGKTVGASWCSKPEDIFNKAKEKIDKAKDIEALSKELEKIDFSVFVGGVIKSLEEYKNVEVTKLYDNFSFIVYDQISKVEVITYETPYSLMVKDNNNQTKEIPATYELSKLAR